MYTHRNCPEETQKLPFVHFSSKLPDNPTSSDLLRLYRSLYHQAVAAERSHTADQAEELVRETGPAVISYNLAMTSSTMAICPRRSGEASFIFSQGETGNIARKVDSNALRSNRDSKTTGTGGSHIDPPPVNTKIGPIAMNGTILAGTLMVKTEQEWNGLRLEHEKLADMLGYIGVPNNEAQEKQKL